MDELRADILADLLEGGDDGGEADVDARSGREGSGTAGPSGPSDGPANGDLVRDDKPDGRNTHESRTKDTKARARTEILVLITAETLFGADEQPAELHGYGPISPETARRLARQAARWTAVERHPGSDEILRVGRRRKVPAGLQRWLRARDGTCRFPGCRTNAVISEIDHTKPWSQGGTTDHDNLEHLCRRHHMFKTRGFWKARQHSPGIIEWTSPGGRTYRTDPHLTLASNQPLGQAMSGQAKRGQPSSSQRPEDPTKALLLTPSGISAPDDYGDDPPPF
ncbi:HNH endonuclease [Arthrobacter gengyunqii]|uniref:HNH endonuclease n=1 Tax=Arthrobacter gengyunqii TaxID=2886940 RepID=A0A9X1M3E2_9MICC|nr:HNH endonuclease signature motif containing protein [Arthrobacter gengyunqii]MCC3270648.1 HNH endonuclease [Arthrobacter gengyunqii]UOY96732.1 HNH endonuclease [Arthrobacter gengyunqii]